MSTVAAEIQRLQASKAAIKAAIEAKGVTVGNGTIDTYAAKVDAIQTGGVVGTGTYLVRFFDFDGTILKQQRVNAGENATAPTVPTHQYLTFNSWNNAFTNVQGDIDTGAIYDTTDGKSYLFITLTAVTGLSPTLYFNKSTTSLMTINWGDGTTSTSTTAGNQNINHTYATAGNYVITVQNSAGGTYSFGNTSTNNIFGSTNYKYILTKIYFGAYITTVTASTFQTYWCLKYVSLPHGIISFADGVFRECRGLIHINTPATTTSIGTFLILYCDSVRHAIIGGNITSIGSDNFRGCSSLKDLKFPKGTITSLTGAYTSQALESVYIPSNYTTTGNTFYSDYSLKSVDLPISITSIGSGFVQNCYSLEYLIVRRVVPPTLVNIDALSGLSAAFKIYVPDASVNAYKTATNWVTYANYIYPLSQLNS